MHKVSVREISRVTGFSPATVSNALNHKRNVSEETAEKIRSVAKSLGYQHPSQLDAIKFVVARKTGAIVDDSTFHPSVIEGVERQARRHGMGAAFVSLDFSDLDAVRPQVAELVGDPSSAVVLLGTELGEEDYELFRSCPARMVVLDGWSDRFDFDAVVMANEGSVLRVVQYLVERGHRSIGYLSGDFRIQNFRARERGFFRGLDEGGLGFDPRWRVELGTTLERAYGDMAAWLSRVSRDSLPTAFFADNDVLAVGAMRALTEAGIRVPEDVSIVGFDDLSLGAFSTPPLTTVHVLKHEVGEIAVRRLIGNVNNPKNYTCKTLVSTYFVERKSVCDR